MKIFRIFCIKSNKYELEFAKKYIKYKENRKGQVCVNCEELEESFLDLGQN